MPGAYRPRRPRRRRPASIGCIGVTRRRLRRDGGARDLLASAPKSCHKREEAGAIREELPIARFDPTPQRLEVLAGRVRRECPLCLRWRVVLERGSSRLGERLRGAAGSSSVLPLL